MAIIRGKSESRGTIFGSSENSSAKIKAVNKIIQNVITSYNELTNKPKINGVTLIGNKTSEDLNINIDLSEYVTHTQLTLSLEEFEQLLLQIIYTKQQTNLLLEGKQNLIDDENKLMSDLISTVNQINQFVTDTEKEYWNNKSNFSGSYNDLSDKPTLFSGSYLDLTNNPRILRNDTGNVSLYSLVPAER